MSRVVWPLVLALVSAPAVASAQTGDVAAARDAYDRGAAAYDAGRYAEAALQLSKADALVPNDVALELALKSAVKANDAPTVMELAERAEPRRSASLSATRDDARARMAALAGQLAVHCAAGSCTATIDDAPFPVGKARWVAVGTHKVVIVGEAGRRQIFAARVEPRANLLVEEAPPPPAVAPAPPPVGRVEYHGVSPAWFWASAGLTAVLGGVTLASALDTRSKHRNFESQPSAELSRAGSDAQLRTNLLAAGTVASAIVAGLVGLVFARREGNSAIGSR